MTQRPDTDDRHGDRESSSPEGASPADSPPAYDAFDGTTSANPPTAQKHNSGAEGHDTRPVRQAPLYTWNNCEVGRGWGLLILEMALGRKCPSASTNHPWGAGLLVKCRDVPRLMREGFFWSADNILPEEGYMSHSPPLEWSSIGFHHERVWQLADKSNGETPLWVAQLRVISHSLAILSGFEVQKLSRDIVHTARGWNAEDKPVYCFDYHRPGNCYNAIYNDMPLRGWWPWPRVRDGWTRPDLGVSNQSVIPGDAGDGHSPAASAASQHESPRPEPHQDSGSCVML